MILVVGAKGMLGQDLLALLGERGRGSISLISTSPIFCLCSGY